MKRFLLLLVVIAVIASTWMLYTQSQVKEPTLPEGITTAPTELRDIESIVSATGNVRASENEQILAKASGKVTEVLVAEGDIIEEGQALARLDDSELVLTVEQAKVSLSLAEAQLERTRQPAKPEDIAATEATLASAKASLAELRRGPSEREIELAKLGIDQAKNSLYGAQANRDAVKGNKYSTGAAGDQAEAAVLNAELAVRIAEIQYEQIFEPPTAAAIAAAETQVVSAEAALAKLMEQPSADDVRISEAQVAQAKVSLQIAENRLETNVSVLESPASGELVSWDLPVGEDIVAGTLMGTVIDTSAFYVRVLIDETDIGRIRVGQSARITLDAYLDDVLHGTVSKIDVEGVSDQGIVSYGVKIALDDSELIVKPSMTSSIDIIVDSVENVLAVPNRALRRDQKGTYLEIAEGGSLDKVYVETGLEDNDYTQITSGIELGQEIVVGRPRNNVFGAQFGG